MRKFDWISINEILVEARGNAHIDDALREAAMLALRLKETVVLTHNETQYEVHPGVIGERLKDCIRGGQP